MPPAYRLSTRRRRQPRRAPLLGPLVLLLLLGALGYGAFRALSGPAPAPTAEETAATNVATPPAAPAAGPTVARAVDAPPAPSPSPVAQPSVGVAPLPSPRSASPAALAPSPSVGVARAPASVPASPVAAAVASPGPGMAAEWLRTVRDTPLWSAPSAPAEQFTILPTGSFVLPRGGGDTGRWLVHYPGDGRTRQPGAAWVEARDLAPSGPPPWVLGSEVDGERRGGPPRQGTIKRSAYLAPPAVTAQQVAVVDEESGLLLYGVNPHSPQAPASTTKIATAMVALRHMPSLSTLIPITVNGWAMAEADGSSIMGLTPGRQVSIRTLLYGLMLPSGNDAAEQLARSLADSRAQFVGWMNDLVAELGLRNTHFVNPSGLDEDGHVASAYDLAQLGRAAMRDQTFRAIVASPTYAAEGYTMEGHNPLIGVYRGADGIKTGTTDAAGRALVASATRNGRRVYVVVMHSDDTQADATALYDWVWQSFSW